MVDSFPRLEKHWLARIERHIQRGNRDERDEAIVELSRGLTRERELAGEDYSADPRLLRAYLEFFWPNTYVQASCVLRQLPEPVGKALDLGAGAGATSAALLDAGATSVRGIDISQTAIHTARDIVDGADFELGDVTQIRTNETFDTIVLSHVLNEIWLSHDDAPHQRSQLIEKLGSLLNEGGNVVILEPGTRENGREVLKLRDLLVESRWTVVAPCFWQGACPALADDDWCHSAFYWRPPDRLRATSQRVGIRRDVAKCTFLILTTEPTSRPGHYDRVVSAPLHTKGRLRYVVCGDRGRHPLVLLERNLAEHNRAFAKLMRGTVIRHGSTMQKGDGLRLDADAAVEVVAEPDEPV